MTSPLSSNQDLLRPKETCWCHHCSMRRQQALTYPWLPELEAIRMTVTTSLSLPLAPRVSQQPATTLSRSWRRTMISHSGDVTAAWWTHHVHRRHSRKWESSSNRRDCSNSATPSRRQRQDKSWADYLPQPKNLRGKPKERSRPILVLRDQSLAAGRLLKISMRPMREFIRLLSPAWCKSEAKTSTMPANI